MPKVSLTDISIKKLAAPASGQLEVWDDKIPGFGLRIGKSGRRSFVLLYRHQSQPRRLTLGSYPNLGLAEARSKAFAILSQVKSGIDPRASPAPSEPSSADRFPTVLDEYLEKQIRRHTKASTAKEAERLVKHDFLLQWSAYAVGEISKAMVRNRLEDILKQEKPSAANHAFMAIRAFFNWCVKNSYISQSPCHGLSMPARIGERARVLSDLELAQIWNGASHIGYPFGSITHLLILTAQRRGEVASMRWCDLDLNEDLWSIPAELTKAGRPHVIPFTPQVRRLILVLPRINPVWVFPARGNLDKPYIGFNKAKSKLDRLVCAAATAPASPPAAWTLHDLRRTAATGMAKLQIAPHIIERILNHSGQLSGIAGIYNRFSYVPEMRAALLKWEEHCRVFHNPRK